MSKKRFIYGFESLFGGPDEGMPQEETPVIALERSPEEEEKPKPKRRRRRPARVAANAVADTEQQDKRSSSKSFTSDLESLFMDAMTDSYEEDIQEEQTEQPAAAETAEVIAQKATLVEDEVSTPAKAADSEKDKMPEEAAKPTPVRKRRTVRSPRTRGGLDMLIRQTSEETYIEYQSENKRVTFVFDKKKLEKLKVIAKSQKAFLKDIIGDVVSKYIEKYEDSNGDFA